MQKQECLALRSSSRFVHLTSSRTLRGENLRPGVDGAGPRGVRAASVADNDLCGSSSKTGVNGCFDGILFVVSGDDDSQAERHRADGTIGA